MNLRHFLNAAFALFVEAYSSVGKNLLEAVELANESFGIEAPTPFTSVEAQNEASLKQLEMQMMGLG